MDQKTKKCTKCDKTLALSCFSQRKGKKKYLSICKSCKAKYIAKRRANMGQDGRYIFKLKNVYGITKEQYDQILKDQGNMCAVCETNEPMGNGKRFHVDHDHETNEIRGLLCVRCNLGLGYLQDKVENIEKALTYLKKVHTGFIVARPHAVSA